MVRIAQFRHTTDGYVCHFPESVSQAGTNGMVRISEWVEVEFPPRPDAELQHEKLAQLRMERQQLQDRLAKLSEIAA